MEKTIFKGFVPNSEQTFIQAAEHYLDKTYPNRLPSKITKIEKETDGYLVTLKNSLTILDVQMEKDFLIEYLEKKQKEKEKQQILENYFKENR